MDRKWRGMNNKHQIKIANKEVASDVHSKESRGECQLKQHLVDRRSLQKNKPATGKKKSY